MCSQRNVCRPDEQGRRGPQLIAAQDDETGVAAEFRQHLAGRFVGSGRDDGQRREFRTHPLFDGFEHDLADSRCSATTAARTASPTAHGKCRSLDVPFAIRSGAVNFWATAAAHLAAFMAVSVPSTPTTTGLALSVTTNPLQSTQSTLVSTDDDDGSLRRLGDLCADRAQQHPAEPASAVAANDNELGPLGFVDQPVGGPVADNSSLHVHVGISFLPTGQPFGLPCP